MFPLKDMCLSIKHDRRLIVIVVLRAALFFEVNRNPGGPHTEEGVPDVVNPSLVPRFLRRALT